MDIVMEGPFKFNNETIQSIMLGSRIGNYCLVREDEINLHGLHRVHYVGRSDTDLKEELLNTLKNHPYPYFYYRYAESVREAFDIECYEYHQLVPENLDNKIHPAKPVGTNLTCIVQGCEYSDYPS